jgi:hypothetical protein
MYFEGGSCATRTIVKQGKLQPCLGGTNDRR